MKIEGVIKQFEQAGWNSAFGAWHKRDVSHKKSYCKFSHVLGAGGVYVEVEAQAVIDRGELIITYIGSFNEDDRGSVRVYEEQFDYVLTPVAVTEKVCLAIEYITEKMKQCTF